MNFYLIIGQINVRIWTESKGWRTIILDLCYFYKAVDNVSAMFRVSAVFFVEGDPCPYFEPLLIHLSDACGTIIT